MMMMMMRMMAVITEVEGWFDMGLAAAADYWVD